MKPAFDILKAVLFLFLCSCRPAPESRQKAPANPDLEACFVDPPAAFRPWAYWVWINGNVSQAELSRDLEEIKAKGMGGFDIFDCGERFPDQGEVPAGPAFLGSESVKAIGHAIREADRLGLGLGLITSSSWNAGGSWIKPEHANMALFPSERVLVKGPSRFDEKLPFPSFPEKTPKREDGKPLFYKEIAVVAYPNATDSVIRDISLVKDISGQVDQDGRLRWDVPDGEWNIVRFICTNTGKMLHSPSINSNGLVIDHFNPDATQVHFQSIVDSLMKGGITLGDNALKYLYLCSYEVWGISWTPNFQNEFSARRGYSIIPYLPALTGQTIGNEEVTSRFRYDFDKTICDLIVDAHYKNATRISNQYGLQLSAESGGPGPVPVEALKALGALDIPRGEFWYGSNTSLVKEIACAAHIYGKELVEQEAYTSWVMWQEGPCDLKAISDNSFCNGMNKIIFHTYPHHPDGNDSPGWAYYAGTHIGPGRVWWPKAKPFMDYLSRCSFLLRQGLFVGDVCYYYGDQGFNYVPEKNTDPSLGYGYDYDVTNPEVILTRMDAVDGKIVLPDGMSYELLALPSRKDMDLEVLRKIQKLVRAGVTIAGPKPSQSNGLNRYPEKDEEVRKLADELWGDCDGETV
ncbi:MAG: glycosyl hydrolase, partial [Mangrovibacterium sp.]|nr:glycosyl hydrolase [Mangrovibacterium sp.]